MKTPTTARGATTAIGRDVGEGNDARYGDDEKVVEFMAGGGRAVRGRGGIRCAWSYIPTRRCKWFDPKNQNSGLAIRRTTFDAAPASFTKIIRNKRPIRFIVPYESRNLSRSKKKI